MVREERLLLVVITSSARVFKYSTLRASWLPGTRTISGHANAESSSLASGYWSG
jgi:hypothetical protein